MTDKKTMRIKHKIISHNGVSEPRPRSLVKFERNYTDFLTNSMITEAVKSTFMEGIAITNTSDGHIDKSKLKAAKEKFKTAIKIHCQSENKDNN